MLYEWRSKSEGALRYPRVVIDFALFSCHFCGLVGLFEMHDEMRIRTFCGVLPRRDVCLVMRKLRCISHSWSTKAIAKSKSTTSTNSNVYSLLAYLIYYIYMLTWCKHALCMFNVEELVSVLQNIRTLPGDHRIFNIEPIGFQIALDFKHI